MTLRLTEAEAKQLGLYGKGTVKRANKTSMPATNRRKGKEPQQVLFECCQVYWPDCVAEYEGAVPGRKFRIDIAFPAHKLALELDGHEAHSYKDKFQRDRERQNLLTLHGWRILRFTAKYVRSRLTESLGLIKECLEKDRAI